MLVAAVSSIILFRWWRAEDLDPKFRLLLLLLVIQTLLIGVALNINIWIKRCNKLSLSDECKSLSLSGLFWHQHRLTVFLIFRFD